jgi:hypothetical protein
MGLIWANFARAKLATPPSGTGGLSFTVEAGKGSLFPTFGAGDYTYAVFKNAAKTVAEVVKLEARSTDSFTISTSGRGLDGTSAASWTANDYIELCPTRLAFLEVFNAAVVAIGALTPAADRYVYFTSATAAALGTITAFARTVLDDADAPTARTTLGAAASANPVFTGVVTIPDGLVGAPGLRWTSSSTTGLFSSGDNTVRVTCNNSQEAVFSTAGLQLTHALNLSASTAGQIQFPSSQNASADANTLDDYEEGTWTPTVQFGGASTGITYSTQVGYYTKVGNRFLVDAIVQLSNKGSATGAARVAGLPGTVFTLTTASCRLNSLAAGGIGGAPAAVFVNSSSTVALQSLGASATGVVDVTDANFSNTTDVILGGNFRV